MRYSDVAIPLGAAWSSPFAKWQGTLAEVSSLDVAAAVTTRALADRGVAVVVVSSEIPEVLGLADRVLVVADGAVVTSAPAEELDEHKVLDLVMQGAASTSGAAREGDVA
jgi:ABC-type molybdate transport system ATPase subunit